MEHRDLSMYIVLQDGSTKSETPRSIAYELNTGGIKICSEKAVHVHVKIGNYNSSFKTNFLSSSGMIVEQQNIKFGGDVTPNLNEITKECKFNFNLKQSSQNDRCFYFLVFSWITNTNTVGFLVSMPLAVYSKNTIFNQYIYFCSYLSANFYEFELISNIEERENVNIQNLNFLLICMKNGFYGVHCSYIIHQNHPFTIANSMTAVSHAIFDLNSPRSKQGTITRGLRNEEDTYTRVDSLAQTLRKITFKDDEKKIREEHYLETEFLENMTDPLPKVKLRFATCIARSKGQLNKGTGSIKVRPTAVHWSPIQYPPKFNNFKISGSNKCTGNEADIVAESILKNDSSSFVGLNILADICARKN